MRNLNAKQKKMLTHEFKTTGVEYIDDIPILISHEIESVNPHETFWQNAQRFLLDLNLEKQRNEPPWYA